MPTQPPLRLRPLPAALQIAAALLSLLAPAALRAQPATSATAEPPLSSQPFPMIEVGMHTAIINRIGVDRAGRWAVTASDDKTARIWDLATGHQFSVLRVPVGPGDEGKLYAAALSPDGSLVALGGATSAKGQEEFIYLFERASGRMIQRIRGLPTGVFHLAFSPDGHRLAAALGSGGGLQVFERDYSGHWKVIAIDNKIDRSSYSVTFAADGRIVATTFGDPRSQDPGELRLYAPPSGPLLSLQQRRTLGGGKNALFARFSPDERLIAVGFNDTTSVELLDGNSLAHLGSMDRKSLLTNGNLGILAWSSDGRHLMAAGSYNLVDGSNPLVVWPVAGGAPTSIPIGIAATVMDLQPLADRRLVFAGGDPAWGVLEADLQPLRLANGQTLVHGPPGHDHRNLHGNFDAFRLAPNGRWLEFRAVSRSPAGTISRQARFDLQERRLSFPTAADTGGQAPRLSGLPIKGWQNTTHPTLAGKPLPLKNFETSRSLAVSSDSHRFALGSEWNVRVFDQSGRSLWPKPTPVQSPAWLVNLSADGRFVVAGLGDGSIRWYRSGNGSEALALFVHPDGRWVLWTPEGFYDASPATAAQPGGGASLLGYHLNQGRDREATFVSSAQLKQFFRPDLVNARLLRGDEAPVAAAVNQVGDVRELLRATALPPQIRLIGPPQRLPSGEVEITYELIDRGGGFEKVELRLSNPNDPNGALIEGRSNPPVAGINRTRLALPGGKTRARLLAYSRGGAIASDPLVLDLEGPTRTEPTTLHVLAVGVTAYRDSSLRRGVRFAAEDARALKDTLEVPGRLADARLGTVRLLRDAEATRERIYKELEEMARVVQPGDRFVLYLAGHGTALDGEYYFLTQELDNGGNEAVRRQALSGKELRERLSRIQSRSTLLLFDTCSSGTYGSTAQQDLKASVKRFEQLDGRLMLASAGDRRMALESPFRQHGIFTAVVIEGLLGKADFSKDRVVKATELLNYVVETVPEITKEQFRERQEPYQSSQGNFPLTNTSSGAAER